MQVKMSRCLLKSFHCLVFPLERHLDRYDSPGENGDVHVSLGTEVAVPGSRLVEVFSLDDLHLGREEAEVGVGVCEVHLGVIDVVVKTETNISNESIQL